jgi:hypothetical protein
LCITLPKHRRIRTTTPNDTKTQLTTAKTTSSVVNGGGVDVSSLLERSIELLKSGAYSSIFGNENVDLVSSLRTVALTTFRSLVRYAPETTVSKVMSGGSGSHGMPLRSLMEYVLGAGLGIEVVNVCLECGWSLIHLDPSITELLLTETMRTTTLTTDANTGANTGSLAGGSGGSGGGGEMLEMKSDDVVGDGVNCVGVGKGVDVRRLKEKIFILLKHLVSLSRTLAAAIFSKLCTQVIDIVIQLDLQQHTPNNNNNNNNSNSNDAGNYGGFGGGDGDVLLLPLLVMYMNTIYIEDPEDVDNFNYVAVPLLDGLKEHSKKWWTPHCLSTNNAKNSDGGIVGIGRRARWWVGRAINTCTETNIASKESSVTSNSKIKVQTTTTSCSSIEILCLSIISHTENSYNKNNNNNINNTNYYTGSGGNNGGGNDGVVHFTKRRIEMFEQEFEMKMRWLFDVDRSVSMIEMNSTIELLGYTLVASFQNVNHRKKELINVPRVVMGILTSKSTFFLLPSSFFLFFFFFIFHL